MKIVLNRNYGSFFLPKGYVEEQGLTSRYSFDQDAIRTDETLIDYLMRNGKEETDLRVYDLPECTDYMIQDYDGLETLLYVQDGKIHKLHGWNRADRDN